MLGTMVYSGNLWRHILTAHLFDRATGMKGGAGGGIDEARSPPFGIPVGPKLFTYPCVFRGPLCIDSGADADIVNVLVEAVIPRLRI